MPKVNILVFAELDSQCLQIFTERDDKLLKH